MARYTIQNICVPTLCWFYHLISRFSNIMVSAVLQFTAEMMVQFSFTASVIDSFPKISFSVKISLITSLSKMKYLGKLEKNILHHFGASQAFETSIVQQLSFFKFLLCSLFLSNQNDFNLDLCLETRHWWRRGTSILLCTCK